MLMRRSEEAYTGTPALCIISNVTLPWAVRLGCGWNVDPSFFVSHIAPLSTDNVLNTLQKARRPNSEGAVQSILTDQASATVRGSVDHGYPKTPSTGFEFSSNTRRQHRWSTTGRRIAHTNGSVQKVEEGLHIVLVDQMEHWADETFTLGELRLFPNQLVIRLATLEASGHLAIPAFRYNQDWEYLPMWHLLKQKEDRDLILLPLQDMDIDQFLYRVALVQCELEISCFTEGVFFLQKAQAGLEHSKHPVHELIWLAQRVHQRLQPCIKPNLAYERKHCKGRKLVTSYSDECNFEILMERCEDLELILEESALRARSKPMPVEDEGDHVHSSASKRLAARCKTTFQKMAALRAPVVAIMAMFRKRTRG